MLLKNEISQKPNTSVKKCAQGSISQFLAALSAPLPCFNMVFGGKLDEYMERYSTWEEAEEGHKNMVEKAKQALGD